MIRSRLAFLITVQLSILCQLNGQIPTLTTDNTAPLAGENYNIYRVLYEDVDSVGGANITWDFSYLQVFSFSGVSYVNSSSTPFSNDYPDATIASNESNTDNYQYFSVTNDTVSKIGRHNSGGGTELYTDPPDVMRFPFTYQSSYVDEVSGTVAGNVYTWGRNGTISVVADGYGTLILPGGLNEPNLVIDSVLRVVVTEDYEERRFSISNFVTRYHKAKSYLWYKQGIHYPILNFTNINPTGISAQYGEFINPYTVGIENQDNSISSFLINPNPATNSITLYFELDHRSEIRLTISNAIGQTLMVNEKSMNSGMHREEIDISNLSTGIYFVNIEGNSQSLTRKLVVRGSLDH